MWCNLSLRKSIILYISAFVILAILLSAGTATLCNNATKTIESKYPPTGEKYYLTNENGERLGDGNYIGVAPVAMSEKDQRLLSICEVAPIIATPIYSALCIITATLLFYRNKLKKPLTELKAASEMISNNNLNFSIKYDSKDELGELCSSFETMRFTLANNFSEMWRQMEERKQLNAAFAHDLRTPLTVLKGYNEILQSNHDPITKSTAVTMGKHIFRLERYVERTGTTPPRGWRVSARTVWTASVPRCGSWKARGTSCGSGNAAQTERLAASNTPFWSSRGRQMLLNGKIPFRRKNLPMHLNGLFQNW